MRFSRIGIGLCSAAAIATFSYTPAFAATTHTVTVQPGWTMWSIARAYGVSLRDLERANRWVNPYNMLVGTVLKLPVQTSKASNLLSSENLYWMAHVINAEAGGESRKAQVAVGDVVLHRLQSGKYGKTVRDVVFQVTDGHYQFTSVANGLIYSTPNASSVQAAKDVLQRGKDVVPGATVFYNPAQTPAGSWVWSQPVAKRIGNLVFAY